MPIERRKIANPDLIRFPAVDGSNQEGAILLPESGPLPETPASLFAVGQEEATSEKGNTNANASESPLERQKNQALWVVIAIGALAVIAVLLWLAFK